MELVVPQRNSQVLGESMSIVVQVYTLLIVETIASNTGLQVSDFCVRLAHASSLFQLVATGAAVGITVAGDSAGSAGPFSYQLNSPTAILFDNFGFMFILDSGNSRIQKWFPGATFGTTVLAATMSAPSGMRLDLFGNLAVADTNYHRVQVFPVWCRKYFPFLF